MSIICMVDNQIIILSLASLEMRNHAFYILLHPSMHSRYQNQSVYAVHVIHNETLVMDEQLNTPLTVQVGNLRVV